MPTQLLFYANSVPVSAQAHANLHVKAGRDFSFAREVNSVPLTAPEFHRATAEYAVVFSGEDDAIMPVAILGVEAGKNLYVEDDGTWGGRYLPAFIRRYPFVFSSADEGKTFTLCIDDTFSGCNEEGRGERLFDADGERTQYLETVLAFLREYQASFQATRRFCARLKELGLLEPMQAQFSLGDSPPRTLTGFMVIARERLKSLGTEALGEMAKRDELELVYQHLHSLQHFGAMLERRGGRAETPFPGAAAEDATAPEEVGAGPGGNSESSPTEGSAAG